MIREEQGLPKTKQHDEAFDYFLLEKEIEFGEEEGDPHIMEADGFARPTKPWYETLRRIAEALVVDGGDGKEGLSKKRRAAWGRLSRAVKKHADGLSLPPGVSDPLEVVPAEVRRQLSRQAGM